MLSPSAPSGHRYSWFQNSFCPNCLEKDKAQQHQPLNNKHINIFGKYDFKPNLSEEALESGVSLIVIYHDWQKFCSHIAGTLERRCKTGYISPGF